MADRLRAAVLGCGPTGLLAAHGLVKGAEFTGIEIEIEILSRKRKSPLYGCQYLHSSIPGLQLPFERVSYRLVGGMDGYRRKVYGEAEDVDVSPQLLEENHTAYDIRAAYDQLWEQYQGAISDFFFSRGSWRLLQERLKGRGVGLILSSLPAPVLCQEDPECKFESQSIWAMGDAPELGRWASITEDISNRTIICNGDPQVQWYRASKVFGHGTVEWPEGAAPPHGASRVNKPIKTTCHCNPEVYRIGRYGKWEKGVLSHTAYSEAFQFVQAWARENGNQ